MPSPSGMDHGSMRAGSGLSAAISSAAPKPSAVPTKPPNERQRRRLGQHLPDDVAAPRAERLAEADLARALADDHQHDVHDDDAADHQRERHHADQDREDALGEVLPEATSACRTCTSRSCRPPWASRCRFTRSATRASSIAVVHLFGRDRLDRELERAARAEEVLEGAAAGSARTRPASCRRPSPSSR